MANPEHLAILKQGVEVWNKWREDNRSERPDLLGVNLSDHDFSRINLNEANLRLVNLGWANLSHSDLSWADLKNADLRGANLTNADLSWADLSKVKFERAILEKSFLEGTLLRQVAFDEVNFNQAVIFGTVFADCDLANALNLDRIIPMGDFCLGLDTLIKSYKSLPRGFLNKCHLPRYFFEDMLELLTQPVQYYSCFISYSVHDQAFCERLYADLQNHGARCWFAPADLKIGDRIRHTIDLSIHHFDKLILVLSEDSIHSQWVKSEVEAALKKERQQKRTVLFPLMLDRAVFDAEEAWAADIRRTRHIGDFTNWKNHDDYMKAFDRLLRDLKADE